MKRAYAIISKGCLGGSKEDVTIHITPGPVENPQQAGIYVFHKLGENTVFIGGGRPNEILPPNTVELEDIKFLRDAFDILNDLIKH